jgi:putative transposase
MSVIGEYYHIYNRGAHKEPIFIDKSDYYRFLNLLYIANNKRPIRFYNLKLKNIYSYEREKEYVDIIAYCLMPNHFHIAIREKMENSISIFIHKLCTAYSMYFNIKYDHSGTIFQGQYKIKHIGNDDYLRYLIQYIHLNPFGIEEPELMKSTKNEHLEEVITYSKNYEFSSYRDYLGEDRPQKVILARVGLARF